MISSERNGPHSVAPSKVCLIVPCYNEEQRLDVPAFRSFLRDAHELRILFVDDGSRDGTFRVLEAMAEEFPQSVRALKRDPNQGKAEAVRAGTLYALRHFSPEFVGFWDADLATPLCSVYQFVRVLDARPDIEMIFGARVQLLGRSVRRQLARHYLGRVFAITVSTVLQLAIYDTQCGAKLFRVCEETEAVFAEPFLSKWVFDVEILARYQRLFRQNRRSLESVIYEYPLEQWTDIAGSKVGAGDFVIALRDVFRIWKRYLR